MIHKKHKMQLRTYCNYFKYVIQHKYYVFIECWKMGLYWHGITHDLSKFMPSEFFAYAEKFFGGDYAYKYFEVEGNFETAWLLHQRRNKHHWNYWVNSEGKAIDMSEKYIKQMVADWNAMGRKYGDTAKEFYIKNRDDINLSISSRDYLEKLLNYKIEDLIGKSIEEEMEELKKTEFTKEEKEMIDSFSVEKFIKDHNEHIKVKVEEARKKIKEVKE